MNLNHLDYSVYLSVSGFISIDCGLPANSSYSEAQTGINYISDSAFIDTGESKKISTEFKSSVPRQTWNLRSFPQGIRNCYSINITQGTKYLILATFFYGNYDGESKLPHFDLHLGANMWDTIKIDKVSQVFIKELIHVPSLNYIQVCLVNTQLGTLFIPSSLVSSFFCLLLLSSFCSTILVYYLFFCQHKNIHFLFELYSIHSNFNHYYNQI